MPNTYGRQTQSLCMKYATHTHTHACACAAQSEERDEAGRHSDQEKREVLSDDLKEAVDTEWRTGRGSWFQVEGAW